MELEGKKGLLVTVQSRRTCSVATVCLRLAVLSGFRGRFWAKKGCFGAVFAQVWDGTYRLGAPTRGATGEVLGSKLGFGKATT